MRLMLAKIIFCSLMVFSPLLGNAEFRPQSYTAVAFPEWEHSMSLVESEVEVARFMRGLLGYGLLSYSYNGAWSIRLAAAGSFKNDAGARTWSFTLRKNVKFPRGNDVFANDVAHSLSLCGSKVLGAKFEQVKVVEDGVEVRFAEKLSSEENQSVLEGFARCPIVDSSTAQTFGADFGLGTNFVGTGPFEIVEMKPKRRYLLKRVPSRQIDAILPETIEVFSYKSAKDALLKLQSGRLNAFFSSDPEVTRLAAEDELLSVRPCLGSTLLSRKSFRLNCWESGLSIDSRSLG